MDEHVCNAVNEAHERKRDMKQNEERKQRPQDCTFAGASVPVGHIPSHGNPSTFAGLFNFPDTRAFLFRFGSAPTQKLSKKRSENCFPKDGRKLGVQHERSNRYNAREEAKNKTKEGSAWIEEQWWNVYHQCWEGSVPWAAYPFSETWWCGCGGGGGGGRRELAGGGSP